MRPDPEPRLRQLDDDHDAVLDLCDQVLSAAARPEPALGEAQDATLRLLERASEHVGAEQELMQLLAYPSREAHAADHDRLLERLSALVSLSAGPGGRPLPAAAREFREAMEQHISTWDWNLTDFVRRAEAGGDAP